MRACGLSWCSYRSFGVAGEKALYDNESFSPARGCLPTGDPRSRKLVEYNVLRAAETPAD